MERHWTVRSLRTVARLGAAALLFSILFAGLARAADVADCSGLVVDENGVPIPAAQVTLKNSNGQSFHAETNEAGRFLLKNLSPGDYQAEVSKPGYFLLTGQPLGLHTGPNEVTLTLNHEQEVHEKVQVVASPEEIDTQDTAQRSTLTARDVRDIPVPSSHVLQESLVALPEIVRDNQGNLHIGGARPGETQYLLDDFEVGDPVSGALTSRFNVDATRAAQVQTGRVGAEYAHSGASLLSLETPDGDDRWRFGTTDPLPALNVQEGTHLGNWYPRFTFSGPIEKDRFWFADSISLQHTFAVVSQQPSGANISEVWAGDNLLRLQYNISPKHILHASFLYNRSHDINLGLDALDPQSTTLTADEHRAFVSVKDQLWLHDTLYDLGLAADGALLESVPQGTQPYQLLVDGTGGNYFQRLHQRGRRVKAVGSVTAASRQWHGTHQLSAGFNVAGLRTSQTAERGEIQALRADGTLSRLTTFAGAANPVVSNTQAGGYAQDTWALSKRLVLQAGVRADWDRFTGSGMAGPRVSGNYLPFGDDRAKLSVGWGIYNAPLNLIEIGQVYDQQQLDTYYDATGKAVVLGPVTSRFALPAGGLEQPRFTNTSAGWQEKIGRKTLVGVELVARNGYHGFAFVDQQPTQPGGIFLLEDHRKDRYRAATFTARYNLSADTAIFGAYTRSAAHSNEVLDPVLGSIFYAAQTPGPVLWDAPNRFLCWGWIPAHIWGIEFTYFLEYRTGYPYSAVNVQQQLAGPPNSLRFPDYASLNLGLEKKFALRGYLWAARVEAVNITDRSNPTTVVNNTDAPNFGSFARGQERALTLRLRFVGRK